jgi:hypothetical protein
VTEGITPPVNSTERITNCWYCSVPAKKYIAGTPNSTEKAAR